MKDDATELFSEFYGGKYVDGHVEVVENSFEDAVWGLFGNWIDDYFNVFVRNHLGLVDHFEESVPDDLAAENILD